MRLFKSFHVVSVDVRNAMHTSLASSRMKNPISITDGSVNLTLDPHMGGSFLNFSANIDGERLDIMRTTPHDFKTPSDTASFLMAPYPNRIRDGKFQSLDVNIDTCFAGWNGVAEMVWPESKVKVSMHASSNMSHLVLFSPPEKPFFALEPQSQMTDGFNFLAQGEEDTGVAIVPPGGELSVWFSLTVERLS